MITNSIFHQHANFYEICILNDNVVERRTLGQQRVPCEKALAELPSGIDERRAVNMQLSAEFLGSCIILDSA
jgi:hypothetical protein